MSFQAVAWAIKQKLPVVPKFVLVALCERANPDTGECWPGIATVADAVCLSERSVITYIASLVRNGYVMKHSMRGKDGRHRTNHYWIMFDRPSASWISAQGVIRDFIDDIDEPYANPAHGEDSELHVQTASHGPHATVCTPHIEPEPSGLEPEESQQEGRVPCPPVDNFDPKARTEQIERLRAAEQARKSKRLPVIEGSEPWKAWVRHGHSPLLIGHVELNGKRHRGWYFETLYPPKQSTGPPSDTLMKPGDEED